MATIVGNQSSRPPHPSNNGACGWSDYNQLTVPNLAANDAVVLLEVPAGIVLTELALKNAALTGATGTLGYRAKKAVSQMSASQATAALTYFSAAFTALGAAQANYSRVTFEPVKFQEPVQVVFIASAPTTGNGAVTVIAYGVCEGIN